MSLGRSLGESHARLRRARSVIDGPRRVFDAWFSWATADRSFARAPHNNVAGIVQGGVECTGRQLRARLGVALVAAKLLEFAAMLRGAVEPQGG
jgi:hypothetical protein